MSLKILIASFILLTLSSCDFRQSVNKDLVTGLMTRGDGLSCDDVYLSSGEEKISRNSFIYGESFYLNFSNIEGFNKTGGNAFPEMLLNVTNEAGDTIMQTGDMYADYTNGIALSPLLLKASLTVAKPIRSNQKYNLSVKICDKQGDGTFTAELSFNVKENENIKTEKNIANCNEIYLFSKEKNRVITDGKVGFNETVYVIFEGLSGFRDEYGIVYAGLKLLATDNAQNVILAHDDLFATYDEAGISLADFHAQISASIKFTEGEVVNPVFCEVTVFDKKSDASIKASTELFLK